jgi:hypothetical protein
MELVTIGNLLLWTLLSIIILFVWSACVGDPGSTDTKNIILTTVCAILALPVTLIVLILFFIMDAKFKNK